MKKIFVILLGVLAVACLSVRAEAADGLKIGVMDMQQAMNKTNKGKAIVAKMKKKRQKEYGILQKKNNELKKMSAELKQDAFMLDATTRAAREDKLRKLTRDLKRYQEDASSELIELQKMSAEAMYRDLSKVLNEYAAKEGYTVIFEGGRQAPGVPGSIVYYDDTVDITDKIIELFNKKFQ